jgi:hypothetical protein
LTKPEAEFGSALTCQRFVIEIEKSGDPDTPGPHSKVHLQRQQSATIITAR